MADDAGQIDRRLNARVAAADHRHPLAAEQRAVAVRAVGDTLVAVLLFARHAHLPPACAGRQHHAAGLQRCSAFQLDLDQAVSAGGQQFSGALQRHHVDLVVLDVLLHLRNQLGAFGVVDRDEVLDAQGVSNLATETLGHQPSADALAGGVDRGRSAGRAATDHQHVEGLLGGDFLRRASHRARVQFGQNLRQRHAAAGPGLTVQVDTRHRHDLALLDFVLEQCAVDGDVLHAGIQHGQQVQGLNDIRTVLAGQREIGLEHVAPTERTCLLDDLCVLARRVPADLQQSQHQ